MANRQFSIRSLLIGTAAVAAYLGIVRGFTRDGNALIALVSGQVMVFGIVGAIYWLVKRLVVQTENSRWAISLLSTTIAGAVFAFGLAQWIGLDSLQRSAVRSDPVFASLPPPTLTKSIDFLAVEPLLTSVAGLLIAGVGGLLSLSLSAIATIFVSRPYRGRAQAVMTGILTALLTGGLVFWGFVGDLEPVIGAVAVAIVVCYPFGLIWDRAPLTPEFSRRYPRHLNTDWVGIPPSDVISIFPTLRIRKMQPNVESATR